MKKIILPITLIFITLFLTSNLLALQAETDTGTVRGTAYLDVDGDGHCANTSAGEVPVSNIDLTFVTLAGDQSVSLYTGSNGTYGLPSASQGTWLVTAVPNPLLWTVTSANPLQVELSDSAGLVQLNIDFCVKAENGVSLLTSPTHALPEEEIATLLQPAPAISADTPNPVASEQLLTNPPESVNAPNLDKVADTDPPIVPEENWLSYLNQFREMGGLNRLQNSDALSHGSQLHSRYMVLTDRPIAHSESSSNPLFTPEGNIAAQNGNIFATSQFQADYTWAINFWISGPFHLIPMLDPTLDTVGYGNFNAESGTFHMAAVLDVLSEKGNAEGDVIYPLYFPAPDSETWVVRHSLFEWPDPLTSCPGYQRPAGAAIVLQLGDGSGTPHVSSHSLSVGGKVVESCLFTETTYNNPENFAQKTGRLILDVQDAIVIMPRNPLLGDSTYTARVVVDGESHTWSFSTVSSPENN